jgi:cytochrome P450
MLRLLDPAEHSKRRKLWDRAFTPSALKSYQPMLSARVAELRAHLLSRAGAPLDLASWMGWLATDFMGDFAWGGAFALMTAGADKDDVHGLGVGMLRKTEVFGTAPWVRPLSAGYPARWLALTTRAVRTRMERGSAFRDLFHYLVGSRLARPARATLTNTRSSTRTRRARNPLCPCPLSRPRPPWRS